jgi:BirA family biotin operon repressor/biotin-[acetyl-CoA-carboxylase] ligase
MSLPPDESLIQAQLQRAGLSPVKVHTFAELESTSVWLRERALDASTAVSDIQLCATDWQTAGIARRGRTWQTKPGNITFSILSSTDQQPKDLLGLSLVTGIGVASCLAEELGVQVELKWPNDVLLNDLKLGGLLTEITSMPSNNAVMSPEGNAKPLTQILTGIGINMRHDDEVLDLGIGATSLEAASVMPGTEHRDGLIGKLGASVLASHQLFFEQGWAPFAERWKARDWLAGKEVSIHHDQSTEHAVARGVNEQGALLIERAGELHLLYSGNVSIRPTV